eukprot:195118-Prymnesium_polylepis.2
MGHGMDTRNCHARTARGARLRDCRTGAGGGAATRPERCTDTSYIGGADTTRVLYAMQFGHLSALYTRVFRVNPHTP